MTQTAVVIGSGFGGLAAAVRLGAKGYRVTVCEALDAPGGRAYVYKQDGFTFDAGPTIITAPFLLEELWELCGKSMSEDIDLREMDPFYTIRFDDGTTFDYSGDHEKMKAEVAKFNPDDIAGYEQFLEASSKLYDIGFDQLLHHSFDSVGKMLTVLPDLFNAQFYRSVHGLVAKHISHPKLRMVFSFHPLLIGGNPFTATAVYALISQLERRHGVHFAMGGTGTLVTGLCKLIDSQGGTIRTNTPVKEILVTNGKASGVELASGEKLKADVVVSNADSASTYRRLLPARYRHRWTDKKLERARYSMSLFVWYFGTDRQYDDVPHHLMLLGERYKGLLDDIFRKKTLAEDFSLYLHRPTATDASLAPAGCDTFYVLSPVPHLDSGVDWETVGDEYRSKIARFLEKTVLPDLETHIVSSRLLTPIDFKERLLSEKGAAFGLEPVLTQTAWFRPHNKSEEVDGLYIVGAGTHPGAGLPGVISSAKVLDSLVPDAS